MGYRALKRQEKRTKGQVMLEYALALTLMAALGSMLYLFYQGFVYGNLYGNRGEENQSLHGLSKDYKSLGLEQAVSLPLP